MVGQDDHHDLVHGREDEPNLAKPSLHAAREAGNLIPTPTTIAVARHDSLLRRSHTIRRSGTMWMPVCPRALCRRCHWEGWTGKTDWLAETILNTHPVIPGDRAALFRPKMLKAPPRIDDILISCTPSVRRRSGTVCLPLGHTLRL